MQIEVGHIYDFKKEFWLLTGIKKNQWESVEKSC